MHWRSPRRSRRERLMPTVRILPLRTNCRTAAPQHSKKWWRVRRRSRTTTRPSTTTSAASTRSSTRRSPRRVTRSNPSRRPTCRRSRRRSTTPPSISCKAWPTASTSRSRSSRQGPTRSSGVLTPAEADQLIAQHLQCLPIESLPLAQCAGAVLRENIYAERDEPPFDRVAMDGVALDGRAAAGGRRAFRVQATQAAGDPPLTLASPQDCIEVMTGAVLPGGCNTVVPFEELTLERGQALLGAEARCEAWQYVERCGSDTRQGTLLLATGARLRAPEITIAASAGMARIRVSNQPMLAVISTGNELVEPGEPVLAHQVRRSNAYAIVSALRERGFQRVADDHLQDDAEELRERLRFHLETHDVLVLSGGVSMGKFDLVPQVLEELGVHAVFHKVAQRPGKPLWFGIAPSGAAVFGLPGNPVSTLVCYTRYVLPGLLGSLGQSPELPQRMALGAPFTVKAPLTYFIPVRLQQDDWGRDWAMPAPTNGSGDFTSLAGTAGFVELPPGPNTYAKGFVTRLHRWS